MLVDQVSISSHVSDMPSTSKSHKTSDLDVFGLFMKNITNSDNSVLNQIDIANKAEMLINNTSNDQIVCNKIPT